MRPQMIKPAVWDAIAKYAKWSRANSDVMADVHWIGGDPRLGEIYGWAAWNVRKGIITLRNPTASTKTIKIDIAKIFELPDNAPNSFILGYLPENSESQLKVKLESGIEHEITIQPFEILTLETLH